MPIGSVARVVASAAFTLICASRTAEAAAMAFDSTADPVYAANQWLNGQNGGFGFGPWAMTFGGSSGAFMTTSANNGDGTGNIDVANRAWALFANAPGALAGVVRPFTAGGLTGDSTLGIGEQFILQFDNGYVDAGGAVGFGLRNSLGENRFEFYLQGNAAHTNSYRLDIAVDQFTTHLETGAGMTIKFTLTGPDSFQLDIAYGPAAGAPATETFTGDLSGTPGTGIDRFRLFNFQAGGNGRNVFFNSVQVVPEPSSLALLTAGLLMAARRRRRK
jgi:hypothetical protein